MTWMIWAAALLFGLIRAPWYAPAAIATLVSITWFGIAIGANTINGEALLRIAIVIAAIFACWALGRGVRHGADRLTAAR